MVFPHRNVSSRRKELSALPAADKGNWETGSLWVASHLLLDNTCGLWRAPSPHTLLTSSKGPAWDIQGSFPKRSQTCASVPRICWRRRSVPLWRKSTWLGWCGGVWGCWLISVIHPSIHSLPGPLPGTWDMPVHKMSRMPVALTCQRGEWERGSKEI